MKETIRTVTPDYSARRKVKEYAEKMYVPALRAAGQPERSGSDMAR
jgi:hypothetical protein